jgi:hypothetical protein
MAATHQDGCRSEGEVGKTFQSVAADVRRLKLVVEQHFVLVGFSFNGKESKCAYKNICSV